MALNLFGGNNAPGIGSQTFTYIGGGVSDIFAGLGALERARVRYLI
jgi:hypothetical protein